jgi:hypothetical protein
MSDRVQLFVATRKGAWFLDGDAKRSSFAISGPHFFGHIVHHVVLDPRDGRTLLAAAKTGHLGPTVFRSTDRGRTWAEAVRPPAFPKVGEGGRAVDHVFWLTPGHASEPNVWWAGTSPQALFKSHDGGATWDGVKGFNENAMYGAWTGGPQDGTPDGPKMHSINVDPRDAKHVYVGMSSGGVFESHDGGESWAPLNQGIAADFCPIRTRRSVTTRIAWSSTLRSPIASISRTTAASTASIARRRAGTASATRCRKRSATSASRSSSTRRTRTSRG